MTRPGGCPAATCRRYFLGAPPVPLRRECWERGDGDFNDLDWLDGPDDQPMVVLFHGPEGGSRSHYATSLMGVLGRRSWRGDVAHFRGCFGEPNRLPRARQYVERAAAVFAPVDMPATG